MRFVITLISIGIIIVTAAIYFALAESGPRYVQLVTASVNGRYVGVVYSRGGTVFSDVHRASDGQRVLHLKGTIAFGATHDTIYNDDAGAIRKWFLDSGQMSELVIRSDAELDIAKNDKRTNILVTNSDVSVFWERLPPDAPDGGAEDRYRFVACPTEEGPCQRSPPFHCPNIQDMNLLPRSGHSDPVMVTRCFDDTDKSGLPRDVVWELGRSSLSVVPLTAPEFQILGIASEAGWGIIRPGRGGRDLERVMATGRGDPLPLSPPLPSATATVADWNRFWSQGTMPLPAIDTGSVVLAINPNVAVTVEGGTDDPCLEIHRTASPDGTTSRVCGYKIALPQISHHAQAGGKTFYSIIHRPFDAAPRGLVVLLHGGPFAPVSPLPSLIAHAWLVQGYTVATIAYFGADDSYRALLMPGPNATLPAMLDEIGLAIADTRASLGWQGKVVIAGESFGGLLALLTAHRRDDVEGVFLLSPVCDVATLKNLYSESPARIKKSRKVIRILDSAQAEDRRSCSEQMDFPTPLYAGFSDRDPVLGAGIVAALKEGTAARRHPTRLRVNSVPSHAPWSSQELLELVSEAIVFFDGESQGSERQ